MISGRPLFEIELASHIPDEGPEWYYRVFALEIIYYFDKVKTKTLCTQDTRGNGLSACWYFGQRKKDRPNKIGLATVKLLEHKGRTLKVKFLDAIDGTPVLDIKPVFKEFQAKENITQPAWVADLMKNYWH